LTPNELFLAAAVLYTIGLIGSGIVAIVLYKALKRFEEIAKKLEELSRE